MSAPPTVPTVHLNGTSYEALVEQYATALRKLGEASNALHQAAPNARDYYPQGEGAYARASREHLGRLEWLRTVRADLDAVLLGIREQQPRRVRP